MGNNHIDTEDKLRMAFYTDSDGNLKAVEWNELTGEERYFWLSHSDASRVYRFLTEKGHPSKDSLLFLAV